MKVILSLIFSILICAFLIKRIPVYGMVWLFVYFPVMGILIRKILDKVFVKYLVLDELSGFYSLKPDAPKLIRWYSSALDIFLGMIVGFSIVYFFHGGWTK